MNTPTPSASTPVKLVAGKAMRISASQFVVPVTFSDGSRVDFDVIADTKEEAEANAARLVLAWNSHDELVAALKSASQMLRIYQREVSTRIRTGRMKDSPALGAAHVNADCALEDSVAALAAAKAEMRADHARIPGDFDMAGPEGEK